MPLRWGDFRERFDPDKDAGLPRPFLLEGEAIRPANRRMLAEPKDPAKVNPLQPPPRMAPFVPPKFITLPHVEKRYRHEKLLHAGSQQYYLSKSVIKDLRHMVVMSGYGMKAYANFILGKDFRPGVYIGWLDPKQKILNPYTGKIETAMVFMRVPEQFQSESKWGNQTWMHAYALFLWRHDRGAYERFRTRFVTWKSQVIDAARKAYDDAKAKNAYAYNQYLAEWEAWVKAERRRLRPWHW